jgi:2-phospho-L-lactate transferase/gluconeogenesis factor (CofD/UPF0052 family)
MKNWTEADAAKIRELEAKKNTAETNLRTDIDKLTKNCTDADKKIINAFLFNVGQRVVDTLLNHFDPSPKAEEVKSITDRSDVPVPQAPRSVTTHDLSNGQRNAGFTPGVPVANVIAE